MKLYNTCISYDIIAIKNFGSYGNDDKISLWVCFYLDTLYVVWNFHFC